MDGYLSDAGSAPSRWPFTVVPYSDQDAWDVAMYMNAHERPQDPRYRGDLAATRKAYHDSPMSLYGTTVNGHLLGADPASDR